MENQLDQAHSSRSGQAIIEYVLLLAITISIITWAYSFLLNVADKHMVFYGGKLEQQLRTGNVPPDKIWEK